MLEMLLTQGPAAPKGSLAKNHLPSQESQGDTTKESKDLIEQ